MRRFLLAALLAAPSAWAAPDGRQTFSVSLDAGVSGRFADHRLVQRPEAFGLNAGLRLELNALAHLRTDVRYFEGEVFQFQAGRYVDISGAARTPKLLIFALDVHEVYLRSTTRFGDDLFYLHTGLGMIGDLVGTLKGSIGFTYLSADGPSLGRNERALGAYAGLEYLLRIKVVETTARAAMFVAFEGGDPYAGLMADADVMVKFAAGKVFIGPRLDIAYRNLGLFPASGQLFGQTHDASAHLGFALHWGVGGKGGGGKKGG